MRVAPRKVENMPLPRAAGLYMYELWSLLTLVVTVYLDKDKDKAHVSLYIVLFLRREDGQTTKMEFICL